MIEHFITGIPESTCPCGMLFSNVNDILFYFLKCLFLREREYEQGRGREGQMIRNRLHIDSCEPLVGLKLTNCKVMT